MIWQIILVGAKIDSFDLYPEAAVVTVKRYNSSTSVHPTSGPAGLITISTILLEGHTFTWGVEHLP